MQDHSRQFSDFTFVYPVISRRSRGLSIGVNLNPDKVCNFDCIYCEVDRRTPGKVSRLDLNQMRDELVAMIRFARDGFAMHWLMAGFIEKNLAAYQRWPSTTQVFLRNGQPPPVGELFVQSDLGKSLQYMADEEAAHAGKGRVAGLRAARDAFYRGDIAATIAKYHAANGGWVTMQDMADYTLSFEKPLHTRFADIDLYACGPWSQGPVLPQALNILSGMDLKHLGHNSPAYIHAVTEALKLAFGDRHAYYGDPKFVSVPMAQLLSAGYADAQRGRIDPRKAAPGMPMPTSTLSTRRPTIGSFVASKLVSSVMAASRANVCDIIPICVPSLGAAV